MSATLKKAAITLAAALSTAAAFSTTAEAQELSIREICENLAQPPHLKVYESGRSGKVAYAQNEKIGCKYEFGVTSTPLTVKIFNLRDMDQATKFAREVTAAEGRTQAQEERADRGIRNSSASPIPENARTTPQLSRREQQNALQEKRCLQAGLTANCQPK